MMIRYNLRKGFHKMRSVPVTAFGGALVLVVVCGFAHSPVATQGKEAFIVSLIRDDLASLSPPGARESERLHLRYATLLKQIYSARGNTPGWVTGDGPRSMALDMEIAIGNSYYDGLNPKDYHYDTLKRMLATRFSRLPRAKRFRSLARLELLLSDAFLGLANDQAEGRLNRATHTLSKPPPQLQSTLMDALRKVFSGALPEAVIEGFAPQDNDYRGMRVALSRYRRLVAGDEPLPVAAGPALVKGDRGLRVAALVHRLQVAGDMTKSHNAGVFDPRVALALKHFQSRHGLRVDAIAGPTTLAVLNQPLSVWVDKLRVNLERRRELPSNLPPTRLVVNIADFTAVFFAEDKPTLTEKVIVGERSKKTPQISSRIGYLVVNPSWEIPASIARKEILPGARDDPGYFSKHPYQVLAGWGSAARHIDPDSVDWKKLSSDRLPYHFLQPAGPSNPLGRVKFMFANLHDVYIHDTPAVFLFDARQRTFSHGCVRIENAVRLASALLRADGVSAPARRLAAAMHGDSNQRIELPHPIPVYLVYRTAWAKDLNNFDFRPDVYRRDAGMLAALNAPIQLTSE